MQKLKPAHLTDEEWLERRREYQRRYRKRHPDRAKAHDKKSRERKLLKRQTPEGREAYRAYERAYAKKYKLLNPEKVREKQTRHNRKTWRKRQLKHLYGLTPEQYAIRLHEQGNRCALCREPFEGRRRPHIDHCHTTNVIRGILCQFCNFGLGQFFDKPDLLQAAIAYLTRSYARSA